MASLSSQIKAKLQLIGSPKVKLAGGQSPPTNTQRVTNGGKMSYRDGNTSQSPEETPSQHTLGYGAAIQRVQMKNVAFIPAKGISPQGHPTSLQQSLASGSQQLHHITTYNGNIGADSVQQQQKISPQRLVSSTTGNKMVIPANQIKLVKKDGTSPSPEGRQPSKLSPQNIQNQNPNIIPNAFTQMKPTSQKTSRNTNNIKIAQNHQTEEDEATVLSDSEDKAQNLNQIQSESIQSNFNRPKLGLDKQHPVVQGASEGQKTQRSSDQNRIKVISQNKIRKSPSPPHNEALRGNQPPQVINVHHQQSKPALNQQQQPQLATDFIKGMINSSRANTNFLNQGSQKSLGLTNSLKNKAAQQQQQAVSTPSQGQSRDQPKKLSVLNNASKTGSVIGQSDISPPRQTATATQLAAGNQSQQQVLPQGLPPQAPSSKPLHQRNYSPPPTFNQVAPANIQKVQTIKESQDNKPEQSPTTIQAQENTSKPQQEGEQSSYQFPFQRRARSLSQTKQELINSKLGQKPAADPQQPSQQQEKPKSPSPGAEGRNRPVVAKVNFVIAQKGALGQNLEDESATFEKNKEVDEWLMGSGESDATAGSHNSLQQQIRSKQSELEKPVQPGSSKDAANDDHSVEGEEEEDWMFKTFAAAKPAPKGQTARTGGGIMNNLQPNRSRLNEPMSNRGFFDDEDGEGAEEEEESPFDMAPEMSKQIYKPSIKEGKVMLDNLVGECDDISQYIDKVDQYMKQHY